MNQNICLFYLLLLSTPHLASNHHKSAEDEQLNIYNKVDVSAFFGFIFYFELIFIFDPVLQDIYL